MMNSMICEMKKKINRKMMIMSRINRRKLVITLRSARWNILLNGSMNTQIIVFQLFNIDSEKSNRLTILQGLDNMLNAMDPGLKIWKKSNNLY